METEFMYGCLDFGLELYGFVRKLTLIMNPMKFGMDLWFCRIIIFPKLGVLLGFYLNPKIMKSKVGRTPHGTRCYGILPLRIDTRFNCE